MITVVPIWDIKKKKVTRRTVKTKRFIGTALLSGVCFAIWCSWKHWLFTFGSCLSRVITTESVWGAQKVGQTRHLYGFSKGESTILCCFSWEKDVKNELKQSYSRCGRRSPNKPQRRWEEGRGSLALLCLFASATSIEALSVVNESSEQSNCVLTWQLRNLNRGVCHPSPGNPNRSSCTFGPQALLLSPNYPSQQRPQGQRGGLTEHRALKPSWLFPSTAWRAACAGGSWTPFLSSHCPIQRGQQWVPSGNSPETGRRAAWQAEGMDLPGSDRAAPEHGRAPCLSPQCTGSLQGQMGVAVNCFSRP